MVLWDAAEIFNAIFNTAAAVTLIITMVLDNTIPGTREERGLHVWAQYSQGNFDWWEDDRLHLVSISLPSSCCWTPMSLSSLVPCFVWKFLFA